MELWYFNSNDKWSNVASQVSSLLDCNEKQVKKTLLSLANNFSDVEPHNCLSLVQQLASRLHESEKLASVLVQENKSLSNMLAKQHAEIVQARSVTTKQQQVQTLPNNQYDIFSRRNILQHVSTPLSSDEDNGTSSPLSATCSSSAYFGQNVEDCNNSDFSEGSESDNCSVAVEENFSSCTEYNTCNCDDLVDNEKEATEEFDVTEQPTCDKFYSEEETEEELVKSTIEAKPIIAADEYYEAFETTATSITARNKGKRKNLVRFIEQGSQTVNKHEQELLRKRKQKQLSKNLQSAVNR